MIKLQTFLSCYCDSKPHSNRTLSVNLSSHAILYRAITRSCCLHVRKNPAYEGQSLPTTVQLRLEVNPAYEVSNVEAERNPAYGQNTVPGMGEQKHVNDISESACYEQVLYSSQCQELETSMLKTHEYEIPDVKQSDSIAIEGEKTMEPASKCDILLEQST